MPATPLTIACRETADRMFNAGVLCGNVHMMQKLVYEDSVTLTELRTELLAQSAPAEEIASAALAIQQVSNVMECEGNIGLHGGLDTSAAWVITACDALDAAP